MTLRLAQKVAAANNEHPVWKLGAVVSRSNSVLSVGWNKPRNDIRYVDYEHCSVHAEMDAMSRVSNPKGTTVYVARIGRNGNWTLAKPCEACMEALTEMQIKQAIYTIDNHTQGVWKP